jgi:hypothetical protein
MREAQDSSKRFYHAGRDRHGFVCLDDAAFRRATDRLVHQPRRPTDRTVGASAMLTAVFGTAATLRA